MLDIVGTFIYSSTRKNSIAGAAALIEAAGSTPLQHVLILFGVGKKTEANWKKIFVLQPDQVEWDHRQTINSSC